METEKLYRNKDWLEDKYSGKQLSTTKIAKLYNYNCRTILYWLRKLKILVRSRGEGCHLTQGNHCNLSDEARQWIDGELLGDGCIISRRKYSAYFVYGSKYLEYAQYVSDTLKSFGIKQSGKIKRYYRKKTNSYDYSYTSRDYEELLPIRKRWYPKGKKIIPRDLELTPLTLRQEYIGDGHLGHPKNRRPYIELATNGFSISDVRYFVEHLNKLEFKSTRRPSGNTVRISTDSTKDFLDYIGKCPIECYKYKFEY